jgi:hypothetical protein
MAVAEEAVMLQLMWVMTMDWAVVEVELVKVDLVPTDRHKSRTRTRMRWTVRERSAVDVVSIDSKLSRPS